MQSCDVQRRLTHVDARDLGAAQGHGLGQHAAAAADIEYLFPCQIASPSIQSTRSGLMSCRGLNSLFGPTSVRQLLELGDFVVVDVVIFYGNRSAWYLIVVASLDRASASRCATLQDRSCYVQCVSALLQQLLAGDPDVSHLIATPGIDQL